VWTSESFLLAARQPLKRYKAQTASNQATTLLAEDLTANPASFLAQIHDESAEQLDASTAAVGVADSEHLEKGRQKKHAEKAASKKHAFLQSVETTNALETTIDDELLGELKQINIILANSLSTSGLPQAPASVAELAAH